MNILLRIIYHIDNLIQNYHFNRYRKSIPFKVATLRNKERINVLFVLSEISLWKTEGLYNALNHHPRFNPILGTAITTADVGSSSSEKYSKLLSYLKSKKYNYIELYNKNIERLNIDIVFYQQPYNSFVSDSISFSQLINKNALVCNIHYSLHTLSATKEHAYNVNMPLHDHCWLMFMENDLVTDLGNFSRLKGSNFCITGVPIQDEFSQKEVDEIDPWKAQPKKKKRIIYAPHHTIPVFDNWIDYSTFLDVCDIMLEIAHKYKDSVQFAFKPHPALKKKLIDYWGHEKTEEYYSKWERLENAQIAEGNYRGLFKYSDALIHDCGSFTIEYCYEKKPVLYLISPDKIDSHRNDLNKFGQKAFDLHNKGCSKQDIIKFIVSVIYDTDEKRTEREEYFNRYLLPPHGKSASENIIDAILGQGNYSK